MKLPKMLLLFSVLLSSANGWAHGGHIHSPKVAEVPQNSAVQQVSQLYLQIVKTLFQRTCFDCHADQVRHPWYENFPGVHQWMDRDMREAKQHIDMRPDFPFRSHGTPLEDLEAIAREVAGGEMPPLAYRCMHPETGLSQAEKEIIEKWVVDSQKILRAQ